MQQLSFFTLLPSKLRITTSTNKKAAMASTCAHETNHTVQHFHCCMNKVGNTPTFLLHITTSWDNSGSDVPTELSGFIHNVLTRLKCIHTKQIHKQESGVTGEEVF